MFYVFVRGRQPRGLDVTIYQPTGCFNMFYVFVRGRQPRGLEVTIYQPPQRLCMYIFFLCMVTFLNIYFSKNLSNMRQLLEPLIYLEKNYESLGYCLGT